MINQFIVDRQNIVYIGIKNVNNRFCYYISALQRLHSSPTLTQKLLDTDISTLKNFDSPSFLLVPLKIYAKININNIKEVYDEIEKELEDTLPKLNEKMQYGGNPDHILISLLLPAVYSTFGLETLKSVITELNINPNRLNFLLYNNSRIHDFEITNSQKVNNELEKSFGELQKDLQKFKNNEDSEVNFNISTMSIMFKDIEGGSSKYNGHAVNVVYGKNDEVLMNLNKNNNLNGNDEDLNNIYIIDDSVGISPFNEFLERHKNRIGYWEVKDCTDKILRKFEENKNISIDKRLHRDVINIKGVGMIGGNEDSNETQNLNENKSIGATSARNKYHEEIVNECMWYPFIEVKDVKDNVYGNEQQEIYGEIGGTINNEKINENNNLSGGNETQTNLKEQNFKVDEQNNIINTKSNTETFKQNSKTDDNKFITKLNDNFIKFKNSFLECVINKYLSILLIILIIIIILQLRSRYNFVKSHKEKVETFKNKYIDMYNKNNTLKTKIKKAIEIELQKENDEKVKVENMVKKAAEQKINTISGAKMKFGNSKLRNLKQTYGISSYGFSFVEN